ncbi:uncharacterized protein PV07_06162 [Cladophialophora immunda]|uniref:ELYS-like domain-containing protein n=1 Tax=Cladophialophora immunda TaxID=569365 RepID=A0A0D2CH13_9EURO|nr:uncharacterized protein PV07_06162 [Cladophialophora immunda]KIW30418.1 hypothetical protein PV07_06162 [Cladophialophora immunda]OQV10175.1 hypothetical protein CLAIMM_14210 [Cladophialophora immunda]
MAQSLSSPEQKVPDPRTLPHKQEAMIQACKDGQLDILKTLFDELGAKTSEDSTKHLESPQDLFAAAISHGQQSIVRYLHSMYPAFDFYTGAVVGALLKRTFDLDMLQLICSYSAEVVTFEYSDNMTSILSKACEGGAENAPFVRILLDHGAFEGGMPGSYTYRVGAALLPAVQHNQPLDIIKRMASKTTQLSYPIFSAIERRRPDALEVLLNARLKLDRDDYDLTLAQQLLGDAQATQDRQLIALVEQYIESLERQSSKSDSRSTDQTSKGGRKWWPFSTRMENKDEKAKDPSSSADGSGSAKSWWPLSKSGSNPTPASKESVEQQLDDSSSDEDTTKQN